jgi:hypothetical protein
MKTFQFIIKIFSLVLVCLISIFLGCSCNIIGPNTSPVLLWSKSVSSGELIQGVVPITVVSQAQSVLVLGSKQNKSIIYSLRTLDGTVQWEWSDWFTSSKYIFSPFAYFGNNNFIINTIPNLYVIDTQSGNTIWRQEKTSITELPTSGLGNTFYTVISNTTLVSIDIRTQGLKNLFSVSDTSKDSKVYLSAVTPVFDDQNNDIFIVCAWNVGYYTNSLNKTSLLLYSTAEKKILYNLLQREGIANGQNGFLIPNKVPVIRDNKIYLSIGKSIQCNDLMTGKLLWQNRNFDGDFSLSGLLVEKDKLYSSFDSFF